jgi:hypothetical protein
LHYNWLGAYQRIYCTHYIIIGGELIKGFTILMALCMDIVRGAYQRIYGTHFIIIGLELIRGFTVLIAI